LEFERGTKNSRNLDKSRFDKFFFVLVNKNPTDYTQAITKEINRLSCKKEGVSVIEISAVA